MWKDREMLEARTPDELVALALAVSEEGMRAGKLPVGAVVVMGDEVVGAAGIPAVWRPTRQSMSFSHPPAMAGGHRRQECRDQFRRYAATAANESLRRYAETMAALPDY